jgi:hypothetical protein
MLEKARHRSATEIAEAGKIGWSFVNRLLRLTLLALDIQEAILDGRQAKGMQLEELTSPVPSDWGTNKYVYLVLIQTKMPGTATTALGDGETLGVRVGNVVLLVKPRTAFTEPSPAKSCSSERSSSHDDGRNV